MKRVIGYIEAAPRWRLVAWGILLDAILALIDYFTGDFSLTLFYLLPVFLGAWFVNKWAGLAFAFLSGLFIVLVRAVPQVGPFDPVVLQFWNTGMEISFLVLMSLTLSMLRRELDTEKALARLDHLTGAMNRRSFLELAEYELKQSRRYERILSIAFIDLDNFKTVNDQLGHETGDILLVKVVRILVEHLRSTDLVARLGGDEFCVLFPETGSQEVLEVLEKVRKLLLDAMSSNNWAVTFSIGALTYTTPPPSVEVMLREADTRMYAVKQSGKNMISHATLSSRSRSERPDA